MALFAGSCQQEKLEPVAGNGTVTFTVEAPANVQTKAIADGLNVDELFYEVWITGENQNQSDLTNATKLYQARTDMQYDEANKRMKATITLDLVNDQNFTVLFWAQKSGINVYNTTELTGVTYTNTAANAYSANDNNLDAFYAKAFVIDGATTTPTVTLRRPFAQVNLCTENTKDDAQGNYNIALVSSKMRLDAVPTVFNVSTSNATGYVAMEFAANTVPSGEDKMITVNGKEYYYAGMNYVFAGANIRLTYDIQTKLNGTVDANVNNTISNVPLKENYRTNIIGNLLTSKVDYQIVVDADFYEPDVELGEIEGQTYTKVNNTAEFVEAFNNNENDIIILGDDINLNDLLTRSTEADPTFVIGKGKTLTIDLNGHMLSATSAQTGKNYNMLDVNGGTLTVKNGTIEYEHLGENMGWGSSTNIFNVTAGGVLNLEGVTAKNLGGSDMGFVAHLNNWGEVTLNAENCTLESNYVPVRVFNSGYDMNNVTIKNSELKGVSAAFWVHNYTVEDFGTADKAESQKALLNLNIYNQGNTFSPDLNGIRYGFTNSVRADAYGITKTVSEDGTVVTLGSVIENGLVRRGVAGAEENTTITKAIVGEGITTLYDRTFRRFYALETVELPSTLTTIGAAGSGVFQSCTALKNITIPESVTVIGKGTFQECSSLESINIPAGVTRIEADALSATGLVSVEFHEGVTYFGAQAFRDCKQLKEVIINAPSFTVEPNAFGVMSGALPGTTIYVANSEMKEYLENTLAYKNQFTIVVPGLVSNADKLKEALKDNSKEIITLAAGVTFEGTFEVNRNVKIVSENVASGDKATIKGRVEVRSANPTFENVNFDRNETDSNNAMQTASNALQYKAVVMIYGDQTNTVTFKKCNFFNNNGTHKSAITNVAVNLVVDECYFEGRSSSIYSQANLSVTNSTFNYTGGNNVILSINGCGANGGKVIFKNNVITNKIFALSQFLSTVGFGEGTYHFDVQDNTGAGFDHYFLNGNRVANKTFAEGSETF